MFFYGNGEWEWKLVLSLTRDNRSTIVSVHHTNHMKCCNASKCEVSTQLNYVLNYFVVLTH